MIVHFPNFNLRHLLYIGLACLMTVACINRTETLEIATIAIPAGDDPMNPASECWNKVKPCTGFHAPWDGLENLTEFKCAACGDRLYFRYEAVDPTAVVSETFENERVVDDEDRVEVFFSPAADMSLTYYCAEVDPMGRVMDYACDFYRQFDYGWNFETIETCAQQGEGFYRVVISISMQELKDLGLDLKKGFHLGAFQADFTSSGEVNWFSLKYVDVPIADFHKPDVLIPARVK